jgi:hypothetical protein
MSALAAPCTAGHPAVVSHEPIRPRCRVGGSDGQEHGAATHGHAVTTEQSGQLSISRENLSGQLSGRQERQPDRLPMKGNPTISRADVADFMYKAAQSPEWIHRDAVITD